MTNPENVAALLLEPQSQRVVGFSIASPVSSVGIHRQACSQTTAYVTDTVILEAYRGRGLISTLMDGLEEELRRRGFRYIERHAAVSNGYAGKIRRHYGKRIISEGPESWSEWGPQVHFRISLGPSRS